MPFARPSLSDLRTQVASDIAAAVPGADALLRFSNLGVMADVEAGLAYMHYGYLDWISQMSVPFTAQQEFLEAWSGLVAITRKAATAASGTAMFTGTTGTLLPAGTSVVRSDGTAYTTAADGTIVSGSVTVTVTAVVPAAAGNAVTGTVMTLGAAISGINSTGVAATALTGGADIEADDALRTRMLHRYQAPPQGGCGADYVTWALQVPGVTRAWCNPNGMGTGTVVIYTMFDVSELAHAGFPQGVNGGATSESRTSAATGDQLAVANWIYALQPVTALVYSVSPIAFPVNFTITGLSGAGATVQAAVSAAISRVLQQYGTPLGGTLDLSYINSAIAAITGTTPFVITVPSANIVTTIGYMPTLGTITWA